MVEYMSRATLEGVEVERLDKYKEMLLAKMEELMGAIERIASQVEQIDVAIAEETPVPELPESEKYVRGTE